jgi:hypothetical protein
MKISSECQNLSLHRVLCHGISKLSHSLPTSMLVTANSLTGKAFRQHSSEWYNIGVQDYLPTWRWWWSTAETRT